jgi:hypothetical protein
MKNLIFSLCLVFLLGTLCGVSYGKTDETKKTELVKASVNYDIVFVISEVKSFSNGVNTNLDAEGYIVLMPIENTYHYDNYLIGRPCKKKSIDFLRVVKV